MAKWSEEQDEILREFGNHGPEECARIINRRFGLRRSAESVRRHAYRVGISVIEYHICVECGGKCRKPDKEGKCPACHRREQAESMRRRNAAIAREKRESESGPEYRAADREYAKERQASSRLRRQHGVSQECGDFAKCHAKMSHPWSAA